MLVGINRGHRDQMMYQLAKIEVDTHNFPESWHDLMICTHMDSMIDLTDEELETDFIAVFGEEELERLTGD